MLHRRRARRLPHHGRGGSRHIGRLRESVAAYLSRELERKIYPDDLRLPTGSWRTDIRLDVYRFEVYTGNTLTLPYYGGVVGCWETLTEFYRYRHQGWFISDGVLYVGKPETHYKAEFIRSRTDRLSHP